MHRIKKLFILQLAVILVFSVITVMSSADANIPQGPIDNVDKDNGVNQIMEAGIEDKNFATAIYDSFASANYFGDETKDVRQILGEYEGAIDAANRGIKSIYGIEWLKNATSIDLGNQTDTDIKNYIGDLRPLSMEYIMKTRVKFSKKPYVTTIVEETTTVNDDIAINYDAFDNDIFEVDNIKHSGRVVAILGIPDDSLIEFYQYIQYGGGGSIHYAREPFAYGTNFMSRIYMPVVANKTFKTNVKVTKSATSDNSGKKVVGAKYHLYYNDGDQDYENDELVSDKVYITLMII